MRHFLTCSIALAFACAPDPSTVEGAPLDETDVDVARIASDTADRSCNVVLRHAERAPGPTGFETVCNSGGVCSFVFQATIDVKTPVATGAKVWVQYRSTDSTTWLKKAAAKTPGAPTGFQRYSIRLDSKTFGPGQSATSLQRARLELLPYLRLADGSRVFDHNRVTDDLGSYALIANNQWAIAEDANACRPAGSSMAVLSFGNGQAPAQHGPLLVGGNGTIDYDSNRLTACRGSSGGRATWDITARLRFQPQGILVEQSVRTFDAPNGTIDLNAVRPLPFNFTIPSGTQWVEVWFVNTGLSGCQPAYDSNNGQNFWFTVDAQSPPAIGWVGNAGASTSRDCTARAGVPDPIVLDGYIRERACSFVETDVWAQGLTDDAAQRTGLLAARVSSAIDGVAQPTRWLELRGRFGNDWRYRYELPRDALYYGSKWSTLSYTLEFSTDGVSWRAEPTRTVKRDPTWCNPSWGSCN